MEEQYMAAKDALAANTRLQVRLEEILKSVEHGLETNADMQARVQLSALRINRSGWYKGLKVVDFPTVGRVGPRAVGPSRFWVAAGSVPAPNPDTRQLLEAFRYLPHTFAHRKWGKGEDAKLSVAVLHHVQEARHEKVLVSAIQDGGLPTEEQLKEQTEQISQLSLKTAGIEEEILAFDLQRWELIATQLAGGRSAADCMTRWCNHLRPSVKHSKDGQDVHWTPEEDERLAELAREHSEHNWVAISEALGSGRSAAACLARFRQRQAALESRPWTGHEMRQLRVSFARHAGKGSFWKAIAADLPGRTAEQCMHFWRNHMDTNRRKGRWAPEEDEALRAAVKVLGKKWARVAEAVPTRTQVQCRERYVNVLDPDLKRGQPWTAAEEAVLAQGLKECRNEDGSIRWSQIAERLPGRTDDAVSNHFTSLKKLKKCLESQAEEPKGVGASSKASVKRKRSQQAEADTQQDGADPVQQ